MKSDIVGKSQFDLNAAKPLTAKSEPLAASSSKMENQQEIPDTFVPPNEVKSSPEVPQEELDEAFSDTPPDEDNEPMDIDYSLEYEADENEDEPEDEDEEVEGTAQAALASGVQFDDLGNMVRTVNRKDEATPEQKKKAGDTLLDIRQTDMFEQVVSGEPQKKVVVSSLMDDYFAAFHRKKREVGETDEPAVKAPKDFNVRGFA